MKHDDALPAFQPPGPGAWELETTHFTRPISRFTQQPYVEGFGVGFSASTARFGVMLDRLEPCFVNDFAFMQARPFGAPPGAKGPPPKIIFQLLTRLVPKMRARVRASREAFEKKQWRLDLKTWDEEVRPASDKRHREIQAVSPAALSDDALIEHLKVCRDRLRDMVTQHHNFTISSCLPVGDLLAHVHEWTGKKPGEVLQVLRGSSQISLGVATAELGVLAGAIRADEAATALVASSDDAAAIVERLRAHDGSVGEAMRAYLEVVSFRSLGYDVCVKNAIELPTVLVRAIRVALEGPRAPDDGSAARIAKLRGEIPEEHRAAFDGLLEEARAINRLRDERGHYSDSWALGLARRTLLEVGRRLVKSGAIDDPELAADGSYDELVALIRGKDGPTLEELKRRAHFRATRSVNDAGTRSGSAPRLPDRRRSNGSPRTHAARSAR